MVDEAKKVNISIRITLRGVNSTGEYDLMGGQDNGYADVHDQIKQTSFYTTNPSSGSISISKLSESERLYHAVLSLTLQAVSLRRLV